MPRYTTYLWICGQCRETNRGAGRFCKSCGRDRIERRAQVHASERAVVYVNPLTGERRTPARADVPMPEVYAAQGFERHEILNMTQYEKMAGVVHESSNFYAGNEVTAFKEPEPPKASREVTEQLVKEVQAAAISGPWTNSDNDTRPIFEVPTSLAKTE